MSAPRTWTAMLDVWSATLASLCAVLGIADPIDPLTRQGLDLHLAAWRWMWTLPPCSEGRKAAFTLGAAARLIERWSGTRELGEALSPLPGDELDGTRAESLLRMAAWHVDDARGEQHARTMGHKPFIPAHEAVYSAGGYEDKHDGINFTAPADGKRGALMILHHHLARRQGPKIEATDTLLQIFADLAIATLPDGPWVMTTRDVDRFLELILEDAC